MPKITPPTRRSFGDRWSIWSDPDERRRSYRASSSRPRRRSGTGFAKPIATRAAAQDGATEQRARGADAACAVRTGSCARSATSWQRRRPGSRGRPQ